MTETLPYGGEVVTLEDGEIGTYHYDRIEILDNGYIKCVNKESYSLDIYPPHLVQRVQTHTEHLEDEEWW